MALGEPLPKQVLGHPWVLFSDDKMSKSKGNVIYADELAKRFGTDAVRYYLLSEIPFAQDGNITNEIFINKYNTDLANTLGNLVNRSIAMTNKYFGGKVFRKRLEGEFDNELVETAAKTVARFSELMETYHNADAVGEIISFAKRCNKYIDETTPWVLAKDEAMLPRLEGVLYNLLESIRLLSILLYPVIPETCEKMRAQLGIMNDIELNDLKFGLYDGYAVTEPEALFARIDTEKVLAEMAEEAKKQMAEANKENVVTMEQISIDDFAKVELKAAKITSAEPIKKAKKLLKLTLDDGSGAPRTVASGIAPWYSPEDLIGKTVIVVANLKPATLCGVESNGMILAADVGENDVKVIFLQDVPAGSKIR